MYRTRTQGSFGQVTRCSASTQGSCGTGNAWITTASNLSTCGVGEVKTTTDYVVKNFRAMQKQGHVFFNPFYQTTHSVSASPGPDFQIRSTGFQCVSEGLYHNYKVTSGYGLRNVFSGGTPTPDSLYTSQELEPYIQDVASRVRADFGTGSNNLFETIAEVGKTSAMLDNKLRRLANVLDVLRRKNINSATRSSRQLANEYLAFRYGVRPLINDIDAILRASVRRRSGSIRETWRSTTSVPTRTGSQTWYTDHDYCRTTNVKTSSHSIEIRGTMLGQTDANVLTEIGFRTKGLLTLPIELIPYSFVLDWFSSLGDYLRSMSPTIETRHLGSCVSLKHTRVTTWAIGNTVAISTAYSLVSGITCNVRAAIIEKQRFDLPAASVNVRPNFGFDRNTRVMDAFALVWQKLSDPHVFAEMRKPGKRYLD